MAKRKAGTKKATQATEGQNGGVVALTKELFQAAITLRGSVEPADYKRYVLPIIFLRFLSLRYDRRRADLEALVADKKSDYFADKTRDGKPKFHRFVKENAVHADLQGLSATIRALRFYLGMPAL